MHLTGRAQTKPLFSVRSRIIGALAFSLVLPLGGGCLIIDTGGWDRSDEGFDGDFECLENCEGPPVLDRDGDGLSDDDETRCDTNPDNADSDGDGLLDGDEDRDGDGATNRDECDSGSDPADDSDLPGDDEVPVEPPPPPPPADTDEDGLSDDEEAARGTDPSNPDTDGDGQCDGAEVECNSSPLDPFFTCT